MRFLRGFLFCLLVFLVFTILGATGAKLAGAADGQGLASGAIVIGYGIFAGIIATLLALFLLWYFEARLVIRLNIIFGVILFIMAIILTYRIIQVQKTREIEENTPTSKPVHQIHPERGDEAALGLGFFKPDFYQIQVLQFYPEPEEGKVLTEHQPYDSVVFVHTEMDQYTIAQAPPYLLPAHLKLDYDLLYFRVKRLSREYLEIVVNERTGRTAIVDRFSGEVIFWPDFLLSAANIKIPTHITPDFRIKPLEHASVVSVEQLPTFLRPESVKGFWLEVSLLDERLKSQGRAWIKWRDEYELLIQYSLLS
jgi:hypothetical protein